jgi:hypothetical protein
MRLDLCLQISDLLLGGGDGIGAGDEAARWPGSSRTSFRRCTATNWLIART